MIRFALPLALLMATPALAQEETEPPSLMERGAKMFLEGLMDELEPRLDELQGWADELGPSIESFVSQMGPALADLMRQVEDWSTYERPEILPNGDIIIRKKKPMIEVPIVPAPEDDGSIEL